MARISAAMNTVDSINPNPGTHNFGGHNPGSHNPGAALNDSPEGEPARLSQYPAHFANTYWRSLHYFNLYRMIAAGSSFWGHA